ncbi:MAG: hypothetical protein IKE20_04585, partial [Eggerthellaceae bacterium]|nr:hypothetical protein [Eggerthellaceae bacterium]
NTRIIIVSDHGRDLRHFKDELFEVTDGGKSRQLDLMMPSCLLLVKDFGDGEFAIDDRFMTNADVPALALDGLIDNPVNPYTGNPIDTSPKTGEQHVLFSYDWDTAVNNGNAFLPGYWFSVHDDIRERENWEYLGYR